MPYMKKGKCVYKKNKDGSQGKKVGCTKGSVDDYLKALYANVDDAPKKENKAMKIKKSELLALIKEEIMSEMSGLTIMDDPYDDSQEPESFKVMDQVAKLMENQILVSMDDTISIISNYLVTTQSYKSPKELMMRGLEMLREAGYREADARAIETMITDTDEDMDMMQEGLENISPENMQLVMDAMQKMAPLIGAMSLPVLIGMIYEKLKEMGAK